MINDILNRRSFLKFIGMIGPLVSSCLSLSKGNLLWEDNFSNGIKIHKWKRDVENPVFPIHGGWFDEKRAMNPFVVIHEGKYLLFYSGRDGIGRQRICLATASVDNVHDWDRLGPLFDVGEEGSFDDDWCVLPCVHRFDGKWHLYYTGKAKKGNGLQAFAGIGLATSDDLFSWKRFSTQPILRGDGFSEWPDNKGIAGGGKIIEVPGKDGKVMYRMHYTLATGSPSKDLLVDQAKQSVIAHSYDGINWTNKSVVLRPRLEATYENAATIALNVWKTKKQWRAIYAGIGTKFGAYSICEAVSKDGLHWDRGNAGDNLSLPPGDALWENEMTTYPHIVQEGANLRLFYCGNGYGGTGIGTAVAKMIL